MTHSAASSLKEKTKVFFKARKESGAGTIVDIVSTARGLWYVILRASDKRTFKCRRAQLEIEVAA